jgi:DNA-binding Lrp family transcriptional regulator
MNFDAVDQRILEILRERGRAPHALIAKEVGLSAPAVGERIRKLEQAGVVAGYQAVFDPAALGLGICAFVSIAPQPRNRGAARCRRTVRLHRQGARHDAGRARRFSR